MNTTRATPIIMAAAVTAVRLVLRAVFSRASRPACRDGFSGGHSDSRAFHQRLTSSTPPATAITRAIAPGTTPALNSRNVIPPPATRNSTEAST